MHPSHDPGTLAPLTQKTVVVVVGRVATSYTQRTADTGPRRSESPAPKSGRVSGMQDDFFREIVVQTDEFELLHSTDEFEFISVLPNLSLQRHGNVIFIWCGMSNLSDGVYFCLSNLSDGVYFRLSNKVNCLSSLSVK